MTYLKPVIGLFSFLLLSISLFGGQPVPPNEAMLRLVNEEKGTEFVIPKNSQKRIQIKLTNGQTKTFYNYQTEGDSHIVLGGEKIHVDDIVWVKTKLYKTTGTKLKKTGSAILLTLGIVAAALLAVIYLVIWVFIAILEDFNNGNPVTGESPLGGIGLMFLIPLTMIILSAFGMGANKKYRNGKNGFKLLVK
jgi:hypothetical protein